MTHGKEHLLDDNGSIRAGGAQRPPVDSIRTHHEQLRADLDHWDKLSRSTDLI
jgi:hypothetical protein